MRVALINPKFRLPIDTRTTPHLGLAYLGAVSQRRGDETRIYDADVEDQPLAEFVHEFRPHIVGITANTPQVKQAWRTAAAIKEEMDIPVVLGGPHVSVVAEDLDYESLRKPGVDLIVRGEGEAIWIEIYPYYFPAVFVVECLDFGVHLPDADSIQDTSLQEQLICNRLSVDEPDQVECRSGIVHVQ